MPEGFPRAEALGSLRHPAEKRGVKDRCQGPAQQQQEPPRAQPKREDDQKRWAQSEQASGDGQVCPAQMAAELLEKDPKNRYQSAGAVTSALADLGTHF